MQRSPGYRFTRLPKKKDSFESLQSDIFSVLSDTRALKTWIRLPRSERYSSRKKSSLKLPERSRLCKRVKEALIIVSLGIGRWQEGSMSWNLESRVKKNEDIREKLDTSPSSSKALISSAFHKKAFVMSRICVKGYLSTLTIILHVADTKWHDSSLRISIINVRHWDDKLSLWII